MKKIRNMKQRRLSERDVERKGINRKKKIQENGRLSTEKGFMNIT